MSTQTQSEKLLDTIADEAGKRVTELVLELRDQISEAITATLEDAQDEAEKTESGKRAVLRLPVTITWDLDKRAVQVGMSVSIRRKAVADIALDDPDQHTLPLTDSDGDAFTIDHKTAVRKLAKTLRESGAKFTAVGGSTLEIGGATQ